MDDRVLVRSEEEEIAQGLSFKATLGLVILFEDCMIKLGLDRTEGSQMELDT